MQPVLRGVGFLLHVPAAMALISMLICLLADELYGLTGFALTLAIGLVPGQALLWATREARELQRYHAMRVAAVAWVLVPLVGMTPFLWSAHSAPPGSAADAMGAYRSLLGALFESVSGFTSTGLSVASAAAELPRHIQWWRTFSEWVGGIGVVLLLLTVLPTDRSAVQLYYSEAREQKILPTVKSTVRAIWVIFVGYTAAAFAALWLAGEPAWRALNHGMTAIATGGFDITGDSLASVGTTVQLVTVPFMMLGAISFLTHYRIVREGRFREALWESAEMRLFWALMAGGALLLAAEHFWFAGEPLWVASLVNWVSALSTTGFATGDLSEWLPAPLLVLILGMLIGASAGSTGSGIKQTRVMLLFKDMAWHLKSIRMTRHEISRVRVRGHRVAPEELGAMARTAALLATAYLLLWTAGVIALLHFVPAGTALEHVFFEAASAQGNVGLSVGIVQAEMHPGAYVTFMVLMVTGRLEIFPLLVLAAWLFQRR